MLKRPIYRVVAGTGIMFPQQTSVIEILLLGRTGSLPSCASTLSGLREDFLWGVSKLTKWGEKLKKTGKIGGTLRDSVLESREIL